MNTPWQFDCVLMMMFGISALLWIHGLHLRHMLHIMKQDRHPYWHDGMSGLTNRNGMYLLRIIAILEQEDDAADGSGASERIFGPACLRCKTNSEGAESDPVSKQS